jgi:hypothetical protein
LGQVAEIETISATGVQNDVAGDKLQLLRDCGE